MPDDGQQQTPPSGAQDGAQGTQTPPAGTGAPSGGSQAASGQQSAQQQGAQTWNVADLPEGAQALIRDLRAEAGNARTTAKAQAADEARKALAQEVGKALGLVEDDAAADPAKLTATIAERDAQLRAAQLEQRATLAALRGGANALALLDSRSFVAKLGDLDPAATDLDKQLDALVKATVEQAPQYRTTQSTTTGRAPGSSGGDFAGGPGSPQTPPASLAEAVSRRYAAAAATP